MPEVVAPSGALCAQRRDKDNQKREEPEQNNRHLPNNGTNLRQRGDDGCDASPDTARFPLSITNRRTEVTPFQAPPPRLSLSLPLRMRLQELVKRQMQKNPEKGGLKGRQQEGHDRSPP
jgi:hypothetical protein